MQVLLMAWKMGAQRMGYFSRSEFESGARALKAYDAKAMRRAALALEDEVAAPSALLAFATFAFKFCLTVRSPPSAPAVLAAQVASMPCKVLSICAALGVHMLMIMHSCMLLCM